MHHHFAHKVKAPTGGYAPPPPQYNYAPPPQILPAQKGVILPTTLPIIPPPTLIEPAPHYVALAEPPASQLALPSRTDSQMIELQSKLIAEAVAPAIHRERKLREIAETQKKELERFQAQEREQYERQKDLQLTIQAARNVKARNKYYEHIAEKKYHDRLEEEARRERRRSEGSYDRGSRYSSETLVILDSPRSSNYEVSLMREREVRCGNCRGHGHRESECRQQVVVTVENPERRRRRGSVRFY
ncbi:hypothetical protein EX30DRAFT_373070 [Ascodesmis nigricans]|uniref:Uncharacterized protein n=1 Tax=Ascodesmis nigricans TaxID=341454 RepID=A0A4S2MQK7_9PEZI|nr:hypothetical protein EX30DRAFT_373070 [Ascodesmis nigricans]